MTVNKSKAEFILDAALAAAIKVGTDGEGLVVLYPRGLPRESWRTFSRAFSDNQPELVAYIREQREREQAHGGLGQ